MTQTISYNVMQILFVMAFAPLYAGVLSRLKEMVQSRRGPSIVQPYRDIWKLFHKDQILSEETTWIYLLTPYLVFIIPIFVTILIPVLTDFPLVFAFMGDMLAGGFFLGLAGFFAALAAVDTGNPYGPMGASRTRMVGFLAEPVFMIVFLYRVVRRPIDDTLHRPAEVDRQSGRILFAGAHSSFDCVLYADSCGGRKDPRRQPGWPFRTGNDRRIERA